MEYWDNKGQVYNDKQEVLSPQERAYNFLLKNFGDLKREDAIMGAIASSVPYLANAKSVPQILSALSVTRNFPTIQQYLNPLEDFRLSNLAKKSLDLLKKENKPISIKQNIVEKNKNNYPEVNINAYNDILNNALYKPDYIMQVQPNKRPNYYTFINKDKYDTSVLDMDKNKENYELVNWFRINQKRLNDYIKRTSDEGGDFLIND